MTATKHGLTLIDVAAKDGVAESIWERLPPVKQGWSLPKDQSLLEAIIPKKEVSYIYSIDDTHEQNRIMRTIISKRLKRYPPQRRGNLMVWIAHDWGRIRNGRRSTYEWTYKLRSFSDADIERFINTLKKKRISSWSKILGFVDQYNHAIYDARTSVALNVILDEIGSPYRFFMPDPTNTKLPLIIKDIKQRARANFRLKMQDQFRNYWDYLRLLKHIQSRLNLRDITEIEMRLYEQAIPLAKLYARKYKVPVSGFDIDDFE
jgi:hypothetical protein